MFRSTAVVSAMTLLSRALGLVRDMVLARFGIGAGMDAFLVAFKIPNFTRRLFAEGAFSQAFVPVLSEYKTQREHGEVQALVDYVAGTLLGVLGLLVLVGVLASPALVTLFAPGFWDEPLKFDLTAYMLKFTFPYLLFMALVAFAAGILNSYGRFAAAAFTPVWLNVVLIAAALLIAPQLDEPMIAIAWGVFVAGFVQLLFLLPPLARLRLFPRPRWGTRDPGVKKILKLMVPGIIGSSVSQINLLFDTVLASFLITGSVSWLYFADRLVEFPLGIFGIALATVILPVLSRAHASGSNQQFSHILDAGLRWVLLIGLPAMVGLMLMARPVLSTLFEYDEFVSSDVDMTTLALLAYCVGLPGFMLTKVLVPAFFSRQDTVTPVKIAIRAMIANMVMNVLFVVPMVLFEIPGAHAGLALATALAAYLNAALLFLALRRTGVFQPRPGWTRLLIQIVFAVMVMAVVVASGVPDVEKWADLDTFGRVTQVGLWVTAGAASYLLALRLAGVRLSMFRKPTEETTGNP
ncbi:Proposed peptidoglycan lipid II flippase MurJ [hydrothermal vent metagenome]|uniref:Proposed peptidoglycan lipid II flippase MurJ n=1 Tax=hydrothermal vent metagenome TaxID=652676 RepID=A0A3B0YE79_9ZZZZ